ncbi:glycosyltransferase family 4 protein [Microbacterium trichothecenolyticum]|uniref:glycosyltransferase family 4 protein n=1 Tax=Microbacterium trichothecenolyticum TaxID=69370 RepID=UPI0035BE1DE9
MTERIMVDLLGFTGTRGGTETYASEILTRLPAALPGVDFIGLTGSAGAAQVAGFFPGQLRVIPWVHDDKHSWAAAEIARANAVARRSHADALWTPANFGPIRRGLPRAVTIHDVIYDEIPGGATDRAVRAVTAWLMRRSARTADAVITVSHAAADSIAHHLGIRRAGIHVVPNGSSTPPSSPPPVDELDGLAIDRARPLLLSTGNRMPHKNFGGLLEALAALPPGSRPFAVITGGRDHDPLTGVVAELGLQRDVLLARWLEAPVLEALYARAAVYACPSTAEGFGLPVVDALRRGCLVVANDIPVLREVGGEAVRYADATDPAAFAAAIAGALADPDPRTRIAEGRGWAEQFSWDSAAAGVAAVLRCLLAARGRA